MEYTNGTKATWRYWAWKRLRERLKVHPSFATVMFLSGPSPEDLIAAKKNGFKISNIVAIDTDLKAVTEARKAGCVAIQGDLFTCVTSWTDGDIHGCIADYCGGLTFDLAVKSLRLFNQINGTSIFNFQRGRESDKASIEARKNLSAYGCSKHRGEQFATLVKMKMRIDCKEKKFNESETSEVVRKYMESINPQYTSYRSNRVIMDTVVMTNKFCNVSKLDYIGHQKTTRGQLDSHTQKIVSRLTAAKAIRTVKGAVRLENGQIIQ